MKSCMKNLIFLHNIRCKKCASFVCTALPFKGGGRMLLRHCTEGLTVSPSLYSPILKNRSYILLALSEFFDWFTSTMLIVILAIPSFSWCASSWLQRIFLHNTLLGHLQKACNIHDCCIFLERKHGMNAQGRITLAMKIKPMRLVYALPRLVVQRQLLETSDVQSGTTGIYTFWQEWWWWGKEETSIGQLLGIDGWDVKQIASKICSADYHLLWNCWWYSLEVVTYFIS